ncbi:AraC family transcriptional regulator [Simiduia agarivorans]|nr:helix-turn-helix domain-containing protein [Simiduia agarivorans]
MALHELVFWGKEFRLWMLDVSPNLFFLGSYAYYLDGPFLFLFVRALLYKDFALKRVDLLHLLPLALYAFLLVVAFYGLSAADKVQLIETQHIAYSSPFLYFDAASKYLRVGYALFGLALVWRYGLRLQDSVANINRQDLVWLKAMMLTILLLYCLDALLLTVKLHGLVTQNFNMDLLNDLGVSAYHLNFLAINVLVLLKFSRFDTVEAIDSETNSGQDTEDAMTAEWVQRIEQGMQDPAVYALPNISLDKLADALDIPARKLSQILKHHFDTNFYEFVNRRRIEVAKARLADPAFDHQSITDIFYDVGFNSKSVFNTFFKRMVGQTPSQYRETSRREPDGGKGIFQSH